MLWNDLGCGMRWNKNDSQMWAIDFVVVELGYSDA